MNKRIEQLLEKYYKAGCTLEEEKELQGFFEGHRIEHSPESALFTYFAAQRGQSLEKPIGVKVRRQAFQMRYLLGIAASLVILTMAYFSWTPPSTPVSSKHVIVDTPEEALKVTLNALSIVNGSMEKGEKKVLEGLQHLDKTLIFKT